MAIEFNKVKKDIKKQQLKNSVGEKAKKVLDWTSENKELAVGVVALASSGLSFGGRLIRKHMDKRNIMETKDLYCYDRSLGHYWKLRRELSNNEWLEIDRRKKDGERLADILEELKVLK